MEATSTCPSSPCERDVLRRGTITGPSFVIPVKAPPAEQATYAEALATKLQHAFHRKRMANDGACGASADQSGCVVTSGESGLPHPPFAAAMTTLALTGRSGSGVVFSARRARTKNLWWV